MKTKSTISKNAKGLPPSPATLPKIETKKRRGITPSKPLKVNSEKEDLRQIFSMVKAIRSGDFSIRLDLGDDSLIGDIAEVLNDINELRIKPDCGPRFSKF